MLPEKLSYFPGFIGKDYSHCVLFIYLLIIHCDLIKYKSHSQCCYHNPGQPSWDEFLLGNGKRSTVQNSRKMLKEYTINCQYL